VGAGWRGRRDGGQLPALRRPPLSAWLVVAGAGSRTPLIRDPPSPEKRRGFGPFEFNFFLFLSFSFFFYFFLFRLFWIIIASHQ